MSSSPSAPPAPFDQANQRECGIAVAAMCICNKIRAAQQGCILPPQVDPCVRSWQLFSARLHPCWNGARKTIAMAR
jgi:hypothetical protein